MFKQLKPRKCRICKAEFNPRRDWQRYCKPRCKVKAGIKARVAFHRAAKRLVERYRKELQARGSSADV